ncbi:hypothetical protein [Mycobacterium sp. Lab-001]
MSIVQYPARRGESMLPQYVKPSADRGGLTFAGRTFGRGAQRLWNLT